MVIIDNIHLLHTMEHQLSEFHSCSWLIWLCMICSCWVLSQYMLDGKGSSHVCNGRLCLFFVVVCVLFFVCLFLFCLLNFYILLFYFIYSLC